jgi:predicted DCC family thiol-disulfide oxidoreductase YuxK
VTNGWTGGQYSLYRFVLGACLASHFARQLPDGLASALGLALALVLALGAVDRFAAVALAVLCAKESPALVGPLLAHAWTPPGPYGSFAARGRPDPGGSWRMPPALPLAARLAFVATLLWWLLRPSPESWPAAVLLLLLSLDPSWLPPRRDTEPATLFYDGDCGLCHRAVRFVLAEDRDGRAFRFAPLASEAFAAALPAGERAALPDSLVVRTPDGRVLVRTAAVREICIRLGGIWRALALASLALPERLLDRGYDGVARLRKRIFARPAEACPLVPAELRGRFD